jgi:hypothetical protein
VRRRREPLWRWHRRLALVGRHLEPLPAGLGSSGGIWAVGLVRDEADIVGPAVANLLSQGVERVVVADNLSRDGTAEVLAGLAGRLPVTVLRDDLPAHYQAEKTTLLARAAARAGAGWVLPFDADEIWLAPGTTVAQWLASCDAEVVQVPVLNHVPTAGDDVTEPDPLRRLRWRKAEPNGLHKVVFRAHPKARLEQGNHGVRRPGARRRGLEIRHFPYRSEDQFLRKLRQGSAALAATDLDAEVGKHWRRTAGVGDEELHRLWAELLETHNLPSEWWVPRHGLVEDPVELPPSATGR